MNISKHQELGFIRNITHHLHLLFIVSFLSIFVFFLSACDEIPDGASIKDNKTLSASWNKVTSTLSVSGKISGSTSTENELTQKYVEIHDAANGQLLGAAFVEEDGTWSASATTSACSVHVDLPNGTATAVVADAPADCTANVQGIGSRSVTARDIPVTIKVVDNPVLNDAIPNAVILEPSQDRSIVTGEFVNFRGVALGVGVAAPFAYQWSFGGAAPNSAIQNPGSIQFTTAGTYFIQLTASDNLGIPDPTPATRTITVSDPNVPSASAPVPTIILPAAINAEITTNVGEALFFSGIATNDVGSINFLFEWDFSGAIPSQFGPTPGPVIFSQAGVYLVSLYATDSQGLRSSTPATLTVIVNDNGLNQAPSGAIIDPPADVVINTGNTISFTGLAVDPDMNTPLSYSWDFQGAASDINMSTSATTGPITFTTPGIYNVKMTVTDALGQVNTNPPVRVVTVQEISLPPLANGTIQSQIISPPRRVKILPGESVFFSGEIIGDVNNLATQYLWGFDGGAVNSTMLTPGDITFAVPGKYYVAFYAMDSTGVIVGEPGLVVVKVHDPSRIEAEIESPSKRQVIETGTPVLLDGKVEHLSGGIVDSFEWRVQAHGASSDLFTSDLFAPGTFTFTDIGEYHIYFKITGTSVLGTAFERTDEVIINVTLPAPVTPVTTPGTGGNPGSPIGNPAASGSAIMTPIADMIIPQGNIISFQARGVVPSATNVSYRWDFSGISAPSNLENPAPILFDQVGDFTVTLRISGIDNTGFPFDIFDQRLITVIPLVTPPPVQAPTPPSPLPITPGTPNGFGGIVIPPTDMVINAGDAIAFNGVVISASSVSYQWDFAGNAPVYNSVTPPPVQFNTPGTFVISLSIVGSHITGALININEQRVITVLAPTPAAVQVPDPVTNNTSPQGFIIEPSSSYLNVTVGESIMFAGAGFDPLGFGPLSFQWSFGGSLTNVQSQNPGTISFNRVGTHVVTLLVRNVLGQFDPTPATVIVVVSP